MGFKSILAAVLTLQLAAAASFADIVTSTVGAEGTVKGSIADISKRTTDTFKQMGITTSGSSVKNSGQEQSFKGKAGDKDVNVKLSQAGPNETNVSVTTKQGLKMNKDYSKSVLSQIVEKG